MLACPCCGYETFRGPFFYGSYDVCPICCWEDDGVQLQDPEFAEGANESSLMEAQEAFARTGAAQTIAAAYTRKPTATDTRSPTWRRYDPERDRGAKVVPYWLPAPSAG